MRELFKLGDFTLSSGKKTNFKIDCDALSDEDIETLAKIVSDVYSFGVVLGIPTGGLRLAYALKQYATPSSDTILIVDDVLTTGNSMERAFKQFQPQYVIGIVIFARGECPDWITPIFTLHEDLR